MLFGMAVSLIDGFRLKNALLSSIFGAVSYTLSSVELSQLFMQRSAVL